MNKLLTIALVSLITFIGCDSSSSDIKQNNLSCVNVKSTIQTAKNGIIVKAFCSKNEDSNYISALTFCSKTKILHKDYLLSNVPENKIYSCLHNRVGNFSTVTLPNFVSKTN